MPNPILIAVPPHLVPAVTELIANDDFEPVDAARSINLVNGWTETELRQHYRDSSENMRAFLVYLAQRADVDVSTHDSATAVGLKDWNAVAGMLGAAQRRAGNRYGRDSGPWYQRTQANGQELLKMPGVAAAIVLDEAKIRGDI
jgi:hypothetical protein